jgi:eukaryotic-like serine/threonine-protein kinase
MTTCACGQRMGRFELLDELGRGGFATVYRARDTELSREVALKVLHPHLATSQTFVRRFCAEARTCARLRHPNIVNIYDAGRAEDGRVFFVMELLNGRPLSEVLSTAPMGLSVAVAWLAQLGAAVDYLHTQCVIHRDLKPANVMISTGGTAILMDFGIAHLMDDRMHLTEPGTLIGTPAYMAPEQIVGGPISEATDVYSLGILAYELLCGEPPFTGPPSAVMRDQLYRPAPAVHDRNPNLPATVATAIARALAKEPSARPGSASSFVAMLAGEPRCVSERRASGRRHRSRPALLTVAALLAGCAIVAELAQGHPSAAVPPAARPSATAVAMRAQAPGAALPLSAQKARPSEALMPLSWLSAPPASARPITSSLYTSAEVPGSIDPGVLQRPATPASGSLILTPRQAAPAPDATGLLAAMAVPRANPAAGRPPTANRPPLGRLPVQRRTSSPPRPEYPIPHPNMFSQQTEVGSSNKASQAGSVHNQARGRQQNGH